MGSTLPASKIRRMEKVVNKLRISDIWSGSKLKILIKIVINGSVRGIVSTPEALFVEILDFFMSIKTHFGKIYLVSFFR